ncbi:hypothetical protein BU15DRAFT_67213 [Melanogaster broomeanus]|nr:hypothetical protein BU15DRAFT_67213 [Melanogaster broomeanus]
MRHGLLVVAKASQVSKNVRLREKLSFLIFIAFADTPRSINIGGTAVILREVKHMVLYFNADPCLCNTSPHLHQAHSPTDSIDRIGVHSINVISTPVPLLVTPQLTATPSQSQNQIYVNSCGEPQVRPSTERRPVPGRATREAKSPPPLAHFLWPTLATRRSVWDGAGVVGTVDGEAHEAKACYAAGEGALVLRARKLLRHVSVPLHSTPLHSTPLHSTLLHPAVRKHRLHGTSLILHSKLGCAIGDVVCTDVARAHPGVDGGTRRAESKPSTSTEDAIEQRAHGKRKLARRAPGHGNGACARWEWGVVFKRTCIVYAGSPSAHAQGSAPSPHPGARRLPRCPPAPRAASQAPTLHLTPVLPVPSPPAPSRLRAVPPVVVLATVDGGGDAMGRGVCQSAGPAPYRLTGGSWYAPGPEPLPGCKNWLPGWVTLRRWRATALEIRHPVRVVRAQWRGRHSARSSSTGDIRRVAVLAHAPVVRAVGVRLREGRDLLREVDLREGAAARGVPDDAEEGEEDDKGGTTNSATDDGGVVGVLDGSVGVVDVGVADVSADEGEEVVCGVDVVEAGAGVEVEVIGVAEDAAEEDGDG